MKQSDVEAIYDNIALALDAVGPEHHELLLAKLVLLLAHDLDDTDLVQKRIKDARENLITDAT